MLGYRNTQVDSYKVYKVRYELLGRMTSEARTTFVVSKEVATLIKNNMKWTDTYDSYLEKVVKHYLTCENVQREMLSLSLAKQRAVSKNRLGTDSSGAR